MNFIPEKYNYDKVVLTTLLSQHNYLQAAKILSEKIGSNIDNTFIAGILYVLSLRENFIPHSKLLTEHSHLFISNVREFILANYNELYSHIKPERDFGYKYTSVKEIANNYLFKLEGKPVESIQEMWMRIAVQVAMPDNWKELSIENRFKDVLSTYDMLSLKHGIHATPTCVNAGYKIPQLESCFVVDIGDQMLSIADSIKLVLMGSKCNGGFGIHVGRIRHSRVANRGITKGVPGLLKLFNTIMPYADQLGSRPGACTAYLPIWHTDIETFIQMKNHNASPDIQCPHLNYCVTIPNLFQQRVMTNGKWSLFCPREVQLYWAKTHGYDIEDSNTVDKCPTFCDMYGDEFEKFYIKCEEAGIAKKVINAIDLDNTISLLRCQTGEPFMFYTDNVNYKSNQSHLGTIVQSNLCVSGDTTIVIRENNIVKNVSISSMINKNVEVWNGTKWSLVTPKQTGENQKFIKIEFSNGKSLKCTPYHKFIIKSNINDKKVIIEAKFLLPNMELASWNHYQTNEFINNVRIVNIHPSIYIGASYCFSDPIDHTGMFNDIMTGNCTEIMQVTKPSEIAPTCDLATINLVSMVKENTKDETNVYKRINWELLEHTTRLLVRNLNRVLDRTSGIVPHEGQKLAMQYVESENELISNIAKSLLQYVEKDSTYSARQRNRAIGIGTMGLASMFALLGLVYDSTEARNLATVLRAAVYWYSMDESANLAQGLNNNYKYGSYPTFNGSSVSQGILTPHQWMMETERMKRYDELCKRNDIKRYKFELIDPKLFNVNLTWEDLGKKCSKGMRNSLLTCQMPNVTTSSVFGVSPSIEPFYEIMYTTNNINGSDQNIYDVFRDVMVDNKLYRPKEMAEYLLSNKGRVEGMHIIFDNEIDREKCKNVEKLFVNSFSVNKKKYIIGIQQMAMYIDQAISLNIFFDKPNSKYLGKLSRLSWYNGCKTEYYMRRLASADNISAKSVKDAVKGNEKSNENETLVCMRDNPDCKWCQ